VCACVYICVFALVCVCVHVCMCLNLCACVYVMCVCVLWVRMRVQKYTEQKEVRIHTTILTIKGNCVCPRY
jgi:hypothetical protein